MSVHLLDCHLYLNTPRNSVSLLTRAPSCFVYFWLKVWESGEVNLNGWKICDIDLENAHKLHLSIFKRTRERVAFAKRKQIGISLRSKRKAIKRNTEIQRDGEYRAQSNNSRMSFSEATVSPTLPSINVEEDSRMKVFKLWTALNLNWPRRRRTPSLLSESRSPSVFYARNISCF